jgi:archaellum biogenesis protein FlaJ (TadC family)
MTKKHLQILLPVIIVGIGILLALTASSFASFPVQRLGSAAIANLTPTPTFSAKSASQAGSTDWITLMGVIIVLIVVLPVLFRRSTWTK